MDYETFKKSVEENFGTPYTAEQMEQICQEVFRDTEKAVEGNGDENLDQDGWWEIAMEVLPDYFVKMTHADYGF